MPNLNDVREVKECTNQIDANLYLKLGWKLIGVYSTNVKAPYILGWMTDAPPKHPTTSKGEMQLAAIDMLAAEQQVKLDEPTKKKKK